MAVQRSTLYSDPDTSSLPPTDPGTPADESRPLLAHAINPSATSLDTLVESGQLPVDSPLKSRQGAGGITPLPYAQLACLCICRIVDPIMFTQIFPYVNEMMKDLHVTDDPSKIGFYSGLVESAFAVAQVVSIYHWARLSDIVGRRPVIFMGILGMAIFSATFGLSKTLTGVLVARSLSGLFSGNVAVVHSVLGELTDSTNQALAFPIYSLTWPLGAIIGPLIGGTFANPAERFPFLFATPFWREHPYLLPGLIASGIALAGVGFGYFSLEETLPSKRRKPTRNHAASEGENAEWDDDKVDAPPPPSMKELLRIPAIRALCTSGGALSFLSSAFDVLFVLMCYSPIESGGLAFSTSQIGAALATGGAISVCQQLFVTPFLLARYDLAVLYRTTLALWAYCFAILPLIGAFARFALTSASGGGGLEGGVALSLEMASPSVRAVVWCAIAFLLALSKLACLPFAISMMLAKVHSPSPSGLGCVNGIVQLSMSLTRAFAPALASALYALSLDSGALGGYAWAVVLFACCVAGARVARKLEGGRPVCAMDVGPAGVVE